MNRRYSRLIPTVMSNGGGYNWYVDGDIAGSGDGKSLQTAYKTIAEALAIMTAGQSLWIQPLDDGSAYRESLTVPAGAGYKFYSSGVYTHATTGGSWTGGARISGAAVAANASFTKTGGLTNTYQITVTVNTGAQQFVNVFEDDLCM